MTLPSLLVFFDFGSAGVFDVLRACRGICRPVFAYDSTSELAGRWVEVVARTPDHVDIGGLAPDEVTARVEPYQPAGIVTFSDSMISLCTEIAGRLGLRYHSPAVALGLIDKVCQRTTLAGAGAGLVRYHPIRRAEDVLPALAAVGLPAVLKPARGTGSRDVYLVEDEAQLQRLVAGVLPVTACGLMLEERLTGDPAVADAGWGDYVSVESVARSGEIRHAAVTAKLPLAAPFRETGYVLPALLPEETVDIVLVSATRVLLALGVRDGLTHVELKLTSAGPRLIEVNGRLGGFVSQLLARSAAVDLVGEAVRAAIGAPSLIPERIIFSAVAFQYFAVPPAEAVRFSGIDGDAEVLAIPGVEGIDLPVEPGTALDWRRGTSQNVAVVRGAADSHEQVLRTIARVRAELRPRFIPLSTVFPSEEVRV